MAAAHSGAAYAFVTLVTTDDYLPAALVAAHSLRLAHSHSSLLSKQDKVALGSSGDDDAQGESIPQLGPWRKDKSAPVPQRSNIDLVALVTPATLSVQTIRVLLTVFDRVIGVEPLGVESILAMQQLGQVKTAHDGSWQDVSRKNSDNLALLGRIDLGMSAGAALTKLHTWRLTDYQKIVYLDADVLVLKPLAHLFASPHAFAAAPDTGWPDIFNSGVMVLTPSEDTFAGLLELAANTGSWDGADQGLINEYFGGEVGSGSEGQGGGWARLGFTYNTTALGGYIYAPAFRRFASKVNVAHFVGEDKPWRDRSAAQSSTFTRSGVPARSSESKSMASRWWDVYNSYYPAATEGSADGEDSDLEVKITEKGVEIVERPKKVVAEVPTFHAAWDSVGSTSASSSRGATVDELKAMFHGSGSQKIETGRASEGRYESLPLFGRVALLAPIFDFVAARKVMTPPTPTQQRRELEVSPWDATIGPPPSVSGPEGHQMRNPIDAFYTNAWDQAKDPQTEAERRRVYFNANARAQAEGRGFGYIPPEAREIHTYGHLGGDKPNEQKVKAVFPWEERSQTPSPQRRSPPPGRNSLRREVLIQNDPSLTSTARAPQVTRRFDDYVVPTSSATGDLAHGSLVSRYGNAWDAFEVSTSGPQGGHSAEALAELERQGLSSTSVGGQNGGSSTRRRTKTQESMGTRSRPTSHYVPNNYDQYAPPQPHSGQAALAVPPSAASDCSIDDSINDDHNYPQQLGGGNGASASVGGFGEVEGSGSWASSLTDIVRLGKAAGPSGSSRGGSNVSASRRGIRQGVGLVPSRYGIEADDGDDESSTEESESLQSTSRASRDSPYSQLSPRLGTSTATASTSPPSSSAAFSPSSSASASGEERFLMPASNSGESLGLTAAASSLAVPIPHAREGPGYSRKSQQTEHARTTMTPRSPRTGSGFSSNVPLPSSSPSSVSTVERGPWPYGADAPAGAARTTESTTMPGPAPPLTGRARIRPEKMGRGAAGGTGDPSMS